MFCLHLAVHLYILIFSVNSNPNLLTNNRCFLKTQLALTQKQTISIKEDSNLISILTSLLKISQSLHVAHGTISENTLCSNIDTCLFYGKPFLPSSVAAKTDKFSFPFLITTTYFDLSDHFSQIA